MDKQSPQSRALFYLLCRHNQTACHHPDPNRCITRIDHRLGDNFKKNHSNTGQEASQIDRAAWRKEQKDYWKSEWDSGRFDDM